MTIDQLSIHYGVSTGTIDRWKRKLGLPRRVVGLQDPMTHRDWIRGIAKSGQGYLMVWIPNHPMATVNGYVLQHRHAMELHIGRYLTAEEVVHHRNGNREDNRIENLQLFANNPEHMSATTRFEFPENTDLRRMYLDQHMSTREIGRLYGCDHVCVKRALRTLGVPLRNKAESRRNGLIPSEQEVIEMLKTKTMAEIADEVGVSRESIQQFCHSRKIRSPRIGGTRPGSGAKYPDDDTLRELVKTMTCRQIAEKYQVPCYGLTSHMSAKKIGKQQQKRAATVSTTFPAQTPTSHLSQPPCAQA